MIKINKIVGLVFSALVSVVFLSSSCYAFEITAKYNNRASGYECPGAPDTTLILKSKGMRKVGDSVIITDWEEHLLYDESAPNGGLDVRAKCTPSSATRFGDMTQMFPEDDLTIGQLMCKKGEGISIIVVGPSSPNYEYVADLTVIKDQQSATNATTLYPVLNAQQQLQFTNPKAMEIKTNANPTTAAVQQKGSCKCILM